MKSWNMVGSMEMLWKQHNRTPNSIQTESIHTNNFQDWRNLSNRSVKQE